MHRGRVGVAVTLLAVNLVGDTLGAVLLRDWRTLIGLPIGAAMLAYLLTDRVRTRFTATADSPL